MQRQRGENKRERYCVRFPGLFDIGITVNRKIKRLKNLCLFIAILLARFSTDRKIVVLKVKENDIVFARVIKILGSIFVGQFAILKTANVTPKNDIPSSRIRF